MKTLASILVLLGASISAGAQTAAPKSADSKLVGEWEGVYRTDHAPPGGLWMRIGKDSAWKATMEMTSGSQLIPTHVTDIKVDGNSITWSQELMGMACHSMATVDADSLKGRTDCGHAAMELLMKRK